MKTLDEVINILEKFWICPSSDEANEYCELWSVKDDAIQYLKAYKDDRNDLSALRAFWAEQQANDPLTWDELKQMEGKPVWVEYDGYTPDWEVIENVGATRSSISDFTGDFIETHMSILHKEDMGKTWKAYRKEWEC